MNKSKIAIVILIALSVCCSIYAYQVGQDRGYNAGYAKAVGKNKKPVNNAISNAYLAGCGHMANEAISALNITISNEQLNQLVAEDCSAEYTNVLLPYYNFR